MTRARTRYHGKHLYIGIDVHRKSYTLTCRCDGLVIKRCHMVADPLALVEFCRKQFPGASLASAYEAGFGGFGLHRIYVPTISLISLCIPLPLKSRPVIG